MLAPEHALSGRGIFCRHPPLVQGITAAHSHRSTPRAAGDFLPICRRCVTGRRAAPGVAVQEGDILPTRTLGRHNQQRQSRVTARHVPRTPEAIFCRHPPGCTPGQQGGDLADVPHRNPAGGCCAGVLTQHHALTWEGIFRRHLRGPCWLATLRRLTGGRRGWFLRNQHLTWLGGPVVPAEPSCAGMWFLRNYPAHAGGLEGGRSRMSET